MRRSSTACPKNVNCVQVSRTTRPVTQVALVAVNRASTSPSRPCLLAMGRLSSSVPAAITSRKLTQMVWVALLPASQPFCLRRLNFSFFRFSIKPLLFSAIPAGYFPVCPDPASIHSVLRCKHGECSRCQQFLRFFRVDLHQHGAHGAAPVLHFAHRVDLTLVDIPVVIQAAGLGHISAAIGPGGNAAAAVRQRKQQAAVQHSHGVEQLRAGGGAHHGVVFLQLPDLNTAGLNKGIFSSIFDQFFL